MALGVEASVEAVEIEAFSTEIPDLIPHSKTLYALAQEEFTKVPVSQITEGGATTRPSFRVPSRVQGGAAVNQGTGNGDSIGRGNASFWQAFVVSPVWINCVCEMSALSQLATRDKKRGLISLKAEELKNTLNSAIAGIEAQMYGDGSGAITQIPTNATIVTSSPGSITGVRAMAFTDNQVVQFVPSEGGSIRGYATINVNDPVTSTLYFVGGLAANGSTPTNGTSLASTVTAGDYILINGSTGASSSGTQTSILGTQAWHNSATSGTIAGVNRATYPSRTSTPSINLFGGSVTASLSARIEALLGRAMGADNETKDSGVYLMGEDQANAIANTNYYTKQFIFQGSTDKNPDKTPDVSKKYFQGTYGNRPVNVSYVQPLGRIDMLLTKEWYLPELAPLQLYDYAGGLTVVPIPDPNGNGWLTSMQFNYFTSFNLALSAPRHGLYVTGASVPTI